MYSLAWAQATVEKFLELCTRTQYLQWEFRLYQERFVLKSGVQKPIELKDALVWCLMRSQKDQRSPKDWNEVKRAIKNADKLSGKALMQAYATLSKYRVQGIILPLEPPITSQETIDLFLGTT